uniref:Uncharacterized protein n=1 Tax=Lepeophtheirus salmonis TaxID=72036 RepID=A0A0K2U9A9_LEPSM
MSKGNSRILQKGLYFEG